MSYEPRQPDGRAPAPPDVERELGEFSYMVSHDLAASFRHVSEFSRLLVEDLGDRLTDRQRRHADFVLSASAQCRAMMEQLLVYSRVQQKPLERVMQDASPIAQGVILQLSDEARAAEAEIELESLGEVYADRDLLALALRHLVDNAIKFRRPDLPARIAIRAARDAAGWGVRIIDNGIGMAPEQRERSFRMFHQLQGEGVRAGVGAGLAICRRIARRHDGEARFIDWPEGTCVELRVSAPGEDARGRPR